jgi:transcriptional regulator of acetoin/glycerol metabolism
MLGSGAASHRDHVQAVIEDRNGAARSGVAASWRRSATVYGLDPDRDAPPNTLEETALHQARQAVEPVIRAAQGVLDRLFESVGDSGCCVLLTDANGVPVDRRGAAADDEIFRKWGLWTGAVWSEAVEGTNGVGTCLAEGRALTIHGDQHFHTRNTGLSCTVAPIYDHQGRLAGALDVSSCRADLTAGVLSLIAGAVADAARGIEAQHFRRTFSNARIVLAPETDRAATALLAVDRHDLIVGASRSARLALGITDARIAAQLPAADVLSATGERPEGLADAERGVILRAIARADGNMALAARNLGVSRATLYRRRDRVGLVDVPDPEVSR